MSRQSRDGGAAARRRVLISGSHRELDAHLAAVAREVQSIGWIPEVVVSDPWSDIIKSCSALIMVMSRSLKRSHQKRLRDTAFERGIPVFVFKLRGTPLDEFEGAPLFTTPDELAAAVRAELLQLDAGTRNVEQSSTSKASPTSSRTSVRSTDSVGSGSVRVSRMSAEVFVKLARPIEKSTQVAVDASGSAEPDPLVLAWRLVVDFIAEPDLVRHLDLNRFRDALVKLESTSNLQPGAAWPERLARAQRLLQEKQSGVEPNALWLAWARNVHAFAVEELGRPPEEFRSKQALRSNRKKA